MISIARRNLLTEKTRFAISAGGVAFSVMLILVILSLYQGWQVKAMQYIREIDTDIWVTQNGASDLSSSASVIPLTTKAEIEKLDGIQEVKRFVGRPIQFNINGNDVNAYIVGVNETTPVTGPQHIIEGSSIPKKGQIILDKVLAKNNSLEIGDSIKVFSKEFNVAGIAEGANMFLFQFSFVTIDDASELINLDGNSTYYLVKVKDGQTAKVLEGLKKVEGIEAFERSSFVEKNKRIINEVFLPIVSVLVFISVLVGTAVIGLTIYTVTIEKSREFGVLKALGASNRQVYRILFEQALISGVIGYLTGLLLTFGVLWLVPNFVPVFVTYTRFEDMVFVGLLSLFMSLIASYAPVQRIVKIDPALVFKS